MQHKTRTKALSWLLSLAMVLGLFPAMALPAFADSSVKAHSYTNSQGEVFLGGTYIELGIAKIGSFGTEGAANSSFHPIYGKNGSSGQIGMHRDQDGFEFGNTPNTGDFFLPGTPEERYIVGYKVDGTEVNNNATKRNKADWSDPKTALSTVNQSSGNTLKATTTGVTKDNLKMSTTVSFESDQQFYQTTVTLTNLSGKTLTDVRYVRSFDPDQDLDRKGTYNTYNKVISNPNTAYDATGKNYKVGTDQVAMVVARGKETGEPFFFVAFDTRARASRGVSFAPNSAWQTNDSNSLWAADTGAPTSYTSESVADRSGEVNEDSAIAITFACGNLAPGASTTFTFYSSLAPADKLADVIKAIEKTVGGPAYHVYQNTDGNWPSAKPTSSSDKFGDTYTPPAKTHYTAKYYSKNSFTSNPTTPISGGKITDLTSDDTALYVYYALDQFAVTLYGDSEGKTVLGTRQGYYGQSIADVLEGITNPTMDHHVFEGWSLSEPDDGKEFIYKEINGAIENEGKENEKVITAKQLNLERAKVTGNMFLYPMLIRDRITVHLDVGAKDLNANKTILNGWAGNGNSTTPGVTMTTEQARSFTTDLGEQVNMGLMNGATREGYKLFGWVTKDGTVWDSAWGTGFTYVDTYDKDHVEVGREYNASKHFNYYTMTLTAQWEPESGTVAYEPYTEGAYTITYHLNGGTGTGVTDGKTVTVSSAADVALPTNMTKDGYTFAGWRTSKNVYAANKDAGTIPAPGENLDLIAVWTTGGKTLTLTTMADDGYFAGAASKTYNIIPGTLVTTLETPTATDENRIFNGWANGEDAVTLPFTMGASDLTLSAKWLHREAAPDDSIDIIAKATDPTTITVSGTNTDKYEYSIDGGKTWQTGTTFPVNPTEKDTFKVCVRTKATGENSAPSLGYVERTVTTKVAQDAPDAPGVTVTGETTIEVKPALNTLEYSIDDGTTWKRASEWALRLGTSNLSVIVPDTFHDAGILTPEEATDGMVAYYKTDNASDIDFDVYQFSIKGEKDEIDGFDPSSPTVLRDYAIWDAAQCEVAAKDVLPTEINGIPAYYYYAEEEHTEGGVTTEYTTVTYIFMDGDDFVEVLFWLAPIAATDEQLAETEEDADAIINTLTREDRETTLVFGGLTPGEDCTVLARARETGTQNASFASPATTVKTFKTLTGMTVKGDADPLEVGETLTADDDGAHPVSYQWYRVSGSGSSAKEVPIADATNSTYTVGFDDMGQKLRVRVTQSLTGEPVKVEDTTGVVVKEWEKNEPAPTLGDFTVVNLDEKTPVAEGGSVTYGGSIDDGKLEYSDDGGKTWKDLPAGKTISDAPAGEYYFRTKGDIEKEKAPSDAIGPVELTATYDLNSLLIHTDSNGLSIKEGTKLTAVTNLDGTAYASGLSYRWFRVDQNMLVDENRFDGNIDRARLSVGDGKKDYTVTKDDEGLILVPEVTWVLGDYVYQKTLSTPTPVIAYASDETAAATGGSELKIKVLAYDGTPIKDAGVELWQGNTLIASKITTDEKGACSFETVRDGKYNVVVTETTGDKRTKTMDILFPDDYSEETGFVVEMPQDNISSTLLVSGDAPAIVVEGLDKEALAQKEDGKAVEVQLAVSSMETLLDKDDVDLTIVEKQLKTQQEAIHEAAKAPNGSQKQLQFYEMSVNKIIDGEVDKLAATTNLIDMTLPFVGVQSLFFVNVYRYHGTGVDTITTEPNGEGEYFEIETDHIILHAKNYSTYAIGYKTAITEGEVTENFELVLEPVDGTNGSVYNIVLNAKDAGKVINRFTSADLTFKLTPSAPKTGNIVYSIAGNPDAYIKLNDAHSGEDRFEFYVNGKKAMKEYHDWSAESIILGTVTFGGYGTGWKFEIESAVINTTKYNDNIVITTKDSDAALTVETTKDTNTNPHTALIDPLTITPVTKNLTVNVTFPNTVADHVSDYQDMTLTVSGGDLSQDIVVKLGQTANLGGTDPTTNVTAAVAPGSYPYATTAKITSAYTAGSESTKYPYVTTVDNPLVADKYTVTLTDILTQNTLYTVTVSGAGYRTARYNVLMTGDKTLTFWNNVMDAATVVEAGKDPTLTVTYLAGDIVEDAQINIYDLSAVVSYFGTTSPDIDVSATSSYAKYDLNRDGKIDSIDVAYVLVSWGE